MKLSFILLYLILFLAACDGVHSRKLAERYYLVSDEMETNEIGYKVNPPGQPDNGDEFIEIVHQTIFATAIDRNYLVVKQHPTSREKIIDTITFIYILPLHKGYTYFPEKTVIGPLTPSEYEQESKKLNIKAAFKNVN